MSAIRDASRRRADRVVRSPAARAMTDALEAAEKRAGVAASSVRVHRTITVTVWASLLAGLLYLERTLHVVVESDGIAITLMLLAGVSIAGPLCSVASKERRR